MESGISNKVIEKIKNREVEARPRWKFLILRTAIIIVFAAALFSGAVALALFLELFDQLWIHRLIFHPGGVGIALTGFPYFWLIALAVFIPLAIADFLCTKTGYRYRLCNVALLICGVIFVGGLGLYASGFSNSTEETLEEKVPVYRNVTKIPGLFWLQPEQGLISGVVVYDDREKEFFNIEDPQRNIWLVDYSEARIDRHVEIGRGERIQALGEKEEDFRFHAEEIRPWCKKPCNK